MITTSDVLSVLILPWSGKRETARRVRERTGALLPADLQGRGRISAHGPLRAPASPERRSGSSIGSNRAGRTLLSIRSIRPARVCWPSTLGYAFSTYSLETKITT